MVIAELIRLEESDQGTVGVLKINKEVLCFTLEPSDELNASNISSIPSQQYNCLRKRSSRFGETFEIMNVPNRTNVLFHTGNTEEDTKGCIILGKRVGWLNGRKAVLGSSNAFRSFMQKLDGQDGFHLSIGERYC